MPSAKRATGMFETGRTSSYHIRSVVACQQSAKSSSTFKLVVHRDGGTKRYDFEAENPKVATEIVQNVRGIKNAVERSGTFSKSRRSKQVV
jgi:target of rapamycin complex 2 subunit MAPKAP1